MDRFQVFFLLAGQLGIQQNAAQPHNAIQRGAQFMADGGDEGGLVTAGALQRILIALTLGDIAAKAHQTMTFPHPVVIRHFADLKAGFAPVRIVQPLLIGQRNVMAEDLFIRLHHFCCRLFGIDILRFQVDQLLFAFPGQQFHGPVTAGELFIFITVEHQIRRRIEERAQERGLLFKLDLRHFTLFHLNF